MSSYSDLSKALKASLTSAGFTGDLLAHGDAEYPASLRRFATNAQKNAALVAGVKSAEDTALVIKAVQAYNAQSGVQPVEVVVRSGGHSTAGSSSSEGGVVIDLSRHLNTVRVDKEKKLGFAGAGCTWATVDRECIKYGLATVGGTVNHTGIGGLTLGGGYGWLTGEYGMTIDNLVQVTIVTASGEILTANSTTNSDLFWGLRGGGCNFGCVTEFVYQLHDQRSHVYAGPLIYPPPMMPAVVAALQEWYPTVSPKEAIMLVTTTKAPTPDGKFAPAIVLNLFYNGDEEEGKKRFAKFFELGPIVVLAAMIPYEALNGMQNQAIPYGVNYHLNGASRGPKGVTPEMGQAIFQQLIATANAPGPAVEGDSAPLMALLWEFYNLEKQSSVAVDATAFRMRVPNALITMLINWDGDSIEARNDSKERLRAFKKQADEILKPSFEHGHKEADDTGYGNNEIGAVQTVDAAQALYGGNYPRLQQLKSKYDPGMMFKAWYPIRPSTVPVAA